MRDKNSRNDILKHALALFAKNGYEATSPNAIVEKVGITKPTLYYFFGSKEGLFNELLKTNFEKLDQLLIDNCIYNPNPSNYHDDIYPTLLNITNTLFDFASKNTDFYLMILAISFAPPESKTAVIAKQYQKKHYLLIEDIFYQIANVHSNIKNRERTYAWRLLSLINAQIGFWYQGYGEINDEIAKSIVKHFMHGIFA